jgi:hypothetical protein
MPPKTIKKEETESPKKRSDSKEKKQSDPKDKKNALAPKSYNRCKDFVMEVLKGRVSLPDVKRINEIAINLSRIVEWMVGEIAVEARACKTTMEPKKASAGIVGKRHVKFWFEITFGRLTVRHASMMDLLSEWLESYENRTIATEEDTKQMAKKSVSKVKKVKDEKPEESDGDGEDSAESSPDKKVKKVREKVAKNTSEVSTPTKKSDKGRKSSATPESTSKSEPTTKKASGTKKTSAKDTDQSPKGKRTRDVVEQEDDEIEDEDDIGESSPEPPKKSVKVSKGSKKPLVYEEPAKEWVGVAKEKVTPKKGGKKAASKSSK